jgi:hypothetical protein
MKFHLESGRITLFAVALGAILALSFAAQPVFAEPVVAVQQTSGAASTVFTGNATRITSGTASYNFLGLYGNDTFNIAGGNASGTFVATELLNGTFNIVTGNPSTGVNSSTFSLLGGANSTFNIVQNNFNGSVTMVIIGGATSHVNATSIGPVSSTILSINLGTNSTASFTSQYTGNKTTINIIM